MKGKLISTTFGSFFFNLTTYFSFEVSFKNWNDLPDKNREEREGNES